jgi:hypothetical protein
VWLHPLVAADPKYFTGPGSAAESPPLAAANCLAMYFALLDSPGGPDGLVGRSDQKRRTNAICSVLSAGTPGSAGAAAKKGGRGGGLLASFLLTPSLLELHTTRNSGIR